MKENKKENIVKGISTEDFPENCVERLSNNSCRRGPLIVSEGYPTDLPRRVVQYIYQILVVSFREQKSFVLKTVFLLSFGLSMCEGVGEDSRHGFGHVDNQVRSCICLSEIVFHDMCT